MLICNIPLFLLRLYPIRSRCYNYIISQHIPISDAQIAQAFISRVKDFVDETAVISLLVTNAIFTNKKSEKFLKYFISEFLIEQVTNLEAIKSQLFIAASYPCSILTYRCEKKKNYTFIYYAFKSNLIFRILNHFVYDKADEMRISKKKIENKEYLWTILTYGDEFDVECIETLKRFPDLEASIDGKVDFVQGYITANNGKKCKDFKGYRGGSLTGCFGPYSVNYENIPMLSQELLYDRPRKLAIYTCENKVLVKRTYNKQCWGAAYVKEPLVFCNDFSTFNDYSGENTELLRYIEGILNSKVFCYYSFYMTKVKAAKKPEVVKEDILHFPMPLYQENNENIKKFVSLIIEMEGLVSNQYEEIFYDKSEIEVLQKQIDDMVFMFYGLDEFDISVIEEGINRFDIKNNDIAGEEDYQIFSQYLCDYFNYFMKGKINDVWKSRVEVGDFYTITSFFFEKENSAESGNVDLLGLLGVEKVNSRLIIQNKVIVFEESGFRIVQTKEKSKWSLGRAKKMAAEITRDIMKTGGNCNE